jgi:hypothetical protein
MQREQLLKSHIVMKNFIAIVLFFTAFSFQSCTKNAIPSCIQSTIDQNKNSSDWHVGKVDEYSFQGKPVYAFIDDPLRITDGGATIYDAKCNSLCFIGGIGGLTSCNGEKFSEKAVYRRTIWKR